MKISLIKAAYAIIVLCGIIYAFLVLRGPNGFPGLFDKQHQVHEIELTNQQLRSEIEQKQERIRRLRDNSAEQEIEIRQRLKLAKPGEKIFILDDKKGN